MGKKRTLSGAPKPPSPASEPPAQPSQPTPPQATTTTTTQSRPPKTKLPTLPPTAKITKRPLHHPAIPTPFASATAPKTLYLTASSPFIPTLKRIRRLLLEIEKRHAQSLASAPRSRGSYKNRRKALQPDGRLAAADVEREIAGEMGEEGGVKGEEVFVKATGRAIERALRVGCYFQKEGALRVRVEMGSVGAVDDVEVEGDEEEETPETRVRMVSSVTVAISHR